VRFTGLDHPLVVLPTALAIGTLIWAAIIAGVIAVVTR
jgi:hypothetical protein